MIAQNVIMAVLVGIVITGVIPVVGGIALLATGKIKGSSFWAGVLAFVIAIIVTTIISGIYTLSRMDISNMTSITEDIPPMMTVVLAVVSSVILAAAMGICIAGCMKLRTFKGAVSCGLGFAVSYLLTSAISFVSIYFQFVQINSGAFDSMYALAIQNGAMSKELFNDLKEQIIKTSFSDIIISIINAVASAVLFVAIAIFIMRGVCSKKAFAGIAVSVLIMAAVSLPAAIQNANIATTVSAAISIVSLIIALSMKGKIIPPQKQTVPDPFLQTVEKTRQDEEK